MISFVLSFWNVLSIGDSLFGKEQFCGKLAQLFNFCYISIDDLSTQNDMKSDAELSQLVISKMTKNSDRTCFLVDGVFDVNYISQFEEKVLFLFTIYFFIFLRK